MRASIDSHRRSVVFVDSHPLGAGPWNVSSRSSFLPTRDNSAPCCDSIARLFRINLTAGINQRCLQQRDTRTELRYTTYTHTHTHTHARAQRVEGPFDPEGTEQDAPAPTYGVPLLQDPRRSWYYVTCIFSSIEEARFRKCVFCLNYTVEPLSASESAENRPIRPIQLSFELI